MPFDPLRPGVAVPVQFVVSRALGLDVPLAYVCVFHPLVSAISTIPISLFGIGFRELEYIVFLIPVGIARESQPVVPRHRGEQYSLVGGLVLLASGARLPRVQESRA